MSNREHTTIETVLIQRVKSLEEGLVEARLQIEYLHDKFQETGSGNAVLSNINALIGDPD